MPDYRLDAVVALQGTTADAGGLNFKCRNGIAKADVVFITQKEMIQSGTGKKGQTKYVAWHRYMKPFFANHAMREPCAFLYCSYSSVTGCIMIW